MLGTLRQLWCLYALVALASLAAAISIEEALHIDGIEAYLHQGVKRQASGTGNQAPTTPAVTPTPPRSSAAPASTPASTPAPSSPQSTPPPSQTSEEDKSSAPQSTPQPSKVTTPVVRSTPLVSLSVNQFTTVLYTQINGQDTAITSIGQSTAVITTRTALSTELPTTQAGNGGGSGMTDSKKKIIGGVVGGVGGAILLGGLALVAWRIWGRKNRVSEDDADLMAGTGSALGDKHSAGTSPFQSNLEQYHNPGARPNAAANF